MKRIAPTAAIGFAVIGGTILFGFCMGSIICLWSSSTWCGAVVSRAALGFNMTCLGVFIAALIMLTAYFIGSLCIDVWKFWQLWWAGR